jgi:hypothetical protein
MTTLAERLFRLAASTYYHLSSSDLGLRVTLRPAVSMDECEDDAEDTTTKRVCFAPTMQGCVKALTDADHAYEDYDTLYYVYSTNSIPKLWDPSVRRIDAQKKLGGKSDPHKGYVFDAKKTGEVWSLEPVVVTFQGWYTKKRFYPHDGPPPESVRRLWVSRLKSAGSYAKYFARRISGLSVKMYQHGEVNYVDIGIRRKDYTLVCSLGDDMQRSRTFTTTGVIGTRSKYAETKNAVFKALRGLTPEQLYRALGSDTKVKWRSLIEG